MSWTAEIRVSAALPDHPKLVRLESIVPNALRGLIRLWAYAAGQPSVRATGNLGTSIPAFVDRMAGMPAGFGEILIKEGWVDVAANGSLVIHDWVEHQPYLARANERRARARAAARARWCAGAVEEKPVADEEVRGKLDGGKKSTPNGFHDFVRSAWNEIAGAAGFARVRTMTGHRKRAVNATVAEFGRDEEVWRSALRAYAADAREWPERLRYGIDTFLRPSSRAKWFEGGPTSDPSDPLGGWDLGG